VIDQPDDPNGVNKARSPVNSAGGFSAPEIGRRRWESPLVAAAYQQRERDVNKTTAKITETIQKQSAAEAQMLEIAETMRARGIGELQLRGDPLEAFVQAKVRPFAEDYVRAQNSLRGVREEEQQRLEPMAEARLVNALRYTTTPEYQGSVRAATMANPLQRVSAFAMSRAKTTTQLMGEQEALIAKREELSMGMRVALEDPTLPENAATIDVNAAQLTGVYKKEALVQRALQFKPDITKTYESGRGLIERIGREEKATELAQQVKGGAISAEDLRSQYAVAQKELIKSFQELDEAINTNAKNQDELSEKFEQARDVFSEKESAARKAGVDPGAVDALGAKILSVLSGGWGIAIQGLITAVRETAKTVQYGAVELPMQQAQIGAQMGEMVVGAYQDWRNVAKGDVRAYARLSAFNQVAYLSESARATTYQTGAAILGADASQATINALKTGAGGNLIGATQAGGEGAGSLTRGIMGLDAMAAQQALVFAQTGMRAADVINAVPAMMGQTTYNAVSGAAYGLRGTGARRDDIFNAATSQAGRARLSAAGVDLETMAPTLFAEATAAMGAQFTGANAVGLLAQAGTATRRGLVASESQFIGMAGQIAGAGGDPTAMGKILREAVAAGLDSSKNIGQMVSGIVTLSASSAQMGIDVTGTMQQYMATGVQAATDAGIPKNLAAPMVEAAMAKTGDLSRRAGFDLGTMQQISILRRAAPNMSLPDLNTLMYTGIEQLREVERVTNTKGEAAGAATANRMNLSALAPGGKLNRDLLRASIESTIRKTFTNYGSTLGDPQTDQEIMNAFLNPGGRNATTIWDQMSQPAKSVVNAVSQRAHMGHLGFITSMSRGVAPREGDVGVNGKGVTTAESAVVTAAEQTNRIVQSTMEKMQESFPYIKSVSETFTQLSTAMQALAAGMDPATFREGVGKAFQDMSLPQLSQAGENINTGALIFKAAAEMLADRLGFDRSSIPQLNEPLDMSKNVGAGGRFMNFMADISGTPGPGTSKAETRHSLNNQKLPLMPTK